MTRTIPLLLAWLLMFSACTLRRAQTDLPPNFDARVGDPAVAAAGRPLFLQNCALCHGVRGDGHGVRASDFATPPRDFTNPSWRASVTPARVYRSIRDGIRGTPMPAWRPLGNDALVDLTAYVLSIGPGGAPEGR